MHLTQLAEVLTARSTVYEWMTIEELQRYKKPSCFTHWLNGNTPDSSIRLLKDTEADRSAEDHWATLVPNPQLHVITSAVMGYCTCKNVFAHTTLSNVLKLCNFMVHVLQKRRTDDRPTLFTSSSWFAFISAAVYHGSNVKGSAYVKGAYSAFPWLRVPLALWVLASAGLT